MEILFEILIDLMFEGGLELSKNRNLPKFIRYSLLALILLLFIAAILLIVFVGLLIWNENMWVGLLMFGIGIFFLYSGIKEFRKVYFEKKDENKDGE